MNFIRYIGLLLVTLFLTHCETPGKETLFTKVPSSSTGIDFKNLIRETEEFNVLEYGYLYNGGGVAVGDINNDDLPDIYFTGNLVKSHLYINKGNMQFEEVAEKAGVAAGGLWNTGVAMADVNGDGLLDIYVCRSAAKAPNKRRNLLFINNGDETFSEKGKEFGLDDPAYSTQAAFFDYDLDGDLDMYLLNHSEQQYSGFSKLTHTYKEVSDPYLGDKLFRNDDGHFTDITEESGIISNILGFGLGVIVSDFNQDNWPDIYVSNDYSEEDYLYINRKDGTYKNVLPESMGHVSMFSMGNDAADINNDLLPDIVTLDMLPEYDERLKLALGPENYDKYDQLIHSGFHPQTMRNMLQLNVGINSKDIPNFSEIGELSGMSRTDWSWASLFADYDNDGWKDLFITNGYKRDYLDMDFMTYVANQQILAQKNDKDVVVMDILKKMPSIEIENYMYKNHRNLSFRKVAEEWGLGEKTLSNGAAYADLDNDGDLDLIVNNLNEEASIYKNNSEKQLKNNYLKVHLKGRNKNTYGIGAKVYVHTNNLSQYQELMPVRGFQSSVNPELIFGLADATTVDSLIVVWPDSTVQKKYKTASNKILQLYQKDAGLTDVVISPKQSLFAKSENIGISLKHEKDKINEFKTDRMLPRTLHDLGPKMTSADIDNDGLEDLFICGGKDQPGKLYKQLSNGSYTAIASKALEKDQSYIDADAVFFDANGDNYPDLYVVSGGILPPFQDRLYINDGRGNFAKPDAALPEIRASGSSVTAADINKDGYTDLYVGGRSIPGSYPLSPRSYLLINNGKGKFEDRTATYNKDLSAPGLISDVLFSDVNGDSWQDLIVVGEWTGIGIYINKEGTRFEKNNSEILTGTKGWWNKIHVDDFNRDNAPDIVLGNYGLNNQYKPSKDQPIRLVYKDFDNNGSIDPVLTLYRMGKEVFAYSRDELIGQIASIKKKYPDYKSFSASSPKDFFSHEQLLGTDTLKINTLETIYLQNDGKGKFSVKKFPVEAQFAPVYTITSDDFNNDGHTDLFLAGNQSEARVSTGKMDANKGVLLLNDGKGTFMYCKPEDSGLFVNGDIRDILKLRNNDQILYAVSKYNDSVEIYKRN
ncbi:VCBS repeat-containing protein [Sinomicrobium weinanense]|uniref:VCBS repeat-containing protein n=1 Tax=Sinomicrobium weinanense TaxID=2842200 RepID=A0A926Q2H6_9FLAO|nr:VCBS repeat-containing protein [Sinomicrobium weinanense]MBC9794936.1 VCBS repeat-containing protein [Sinomicrobium weinanense]MBU3125707.1 VCBS repeat-containing protein [Sinomicrobium weinanense]